MTSAGIPAGTARSARQSRILREIGELGLKQVKYHNLSAFVNSNCGSKHKSQLTDARVSIETVVDLALLAFRLYIASLASSWACCCVCARAEDKDGSK